MSWTLEATTSSMPPVGRYVADIKDLSDPEPPQMTEYGDTDQVKFTFTIVKVVDSDDDDAEEYVGQDTYGWCNFTFGPRAKLRKWAQAALGREITDGENISRDDLVGKRVRLDIGLTKTGKRKVAELMPFTTKKKAPAPPPTADDLEEEEVLF